MPCFADLLAANICYFIMQYLDL